MHETLFYILVSVLVVSLISFIGLIGLTFRTDKLKRFLIYLVSFSAGALFGDAFIHLLPEIVEKSESILNISLFILLGILLFFILEKLVHWQHCHMPITNEHIHSFAYMNLIGDALHNFIDGVIIAASYLVNIHTGLATTIAVLLHEIPQEIGDFGILIHGGFSKSRALLLNFLTALFALLGALVSFLIANFIESIELILVPIAIGGFIYIAGSDLIPELHKESEISKSILQIFFFIIGIVLMTLLLLLD